MIYLVYLLMVRVVFDKLVVARGYGIGTELLSAGVGFVVLLLLAFLGVNWPWAY